MGLLNWLFGKPTVVAEQPACPHIATKSPPLEQPRRDERKPGVREIIVDTETTGLFVDNDRIIEIGALELVDRVATGRIFHRHINPQGRRIHPKASAVHGINASDLVSKPIFEAISAEFLAFIDGARLIAHNARFDLGFINAELGRIGHAALESKRVVCTLELARRKHPEGPNSLDALCARYGVDDSRRTRHGALLDCELLAEIYPELMS